jgi:NAD(P)H-flavin reductase
MFTPQKLRCQVKRIANHGDHVYYIDLKPERPLPTFKPGQFLHLALDDYDPSGFWPESRVFSIASSPQRRESLRVSYSVKGKFTTRMEKELHEGKWIWIKMPYSEFVINDSTDVVLLAGGTGITGFAAFIENLTPKFQHHVYLVYGARKRSLLICRDLIEEKIRTVRMFHSYYFIEQPVTKKQKMQRTAQKEGASVREITGCINLGGFWEAISEPQKATFYIAGPPMMNKTMINELISRGIKPECIKIDAWE